MRKNSSQKEYIIKFKDSMAYLKGLGGKKYKYTFNIEEAKRYTKTDAENVGGIKEFEIVNYNQEKYNYKEKQYQLYINVLLDEKEDINRDDLISFCQEYEFASDGSGKFTAYITLKKEYLNSKLIDEVIRLGKLIEQQNKVIMYEMLVNMSKDEEFNIRNNNKVIITEKDTKEYNNAKLYLEEMKEKYPFDYDIEKQYNIVDTAFRDKYISEDLYKEFYESYYDEDYEPNSI